MSLSEVTRILILLLLFSCNDEKTEPKSIENITSVNQSQHIALQVSSRVDTSKTEVKEVLSIYESYINAQPDVIYDNPHWNNAEKGKYKDYDFSRSSIYNGIASDQLFKIYDPFVLSAEPNIDKYQLRVLYSNSSSDPAYVGSKVWCIHKLNVVKEDGSWKLENLLIEKTKNWKSKKVGFIEYMFSEEYTFDPVQANKAIAFCNQIINRFNPDFDDRFKFYLANGVDDMGELENFDYYFSGVTTGKAREGMILSSKSDEHYPHEFIHKLLPANENRGHVIEEGVATFLGTKEDLDKYSSMMQKLANDYNQSPSYNLENILNDQTEWNGYSSAYPGGALICEVIDDQEGDKGINQLVRGKTNGYEDIITLTKTILNRSEREVFQLIDQKMKEYK